MRNPFSRPIPSDKINQRISVVPGRGEVLIYYAVVSLPSRRRAWNQSR